MDSPNGRQTASPNGPHGSAFRRVYERLQFRSKLRTENPIFDLGPGGGESVTDSEFDPFAAGSLRGTRPYFLVPVEEDQQELELVAERIREWVIRAKDLPISYLFRDVDLLQPAALVRWLRTPLPRDGNGTPTPPEVIRQYLRSLLSRRGRALIDTLPDEGLLNQLDEIDGLKRKASDDKPHELDHILRDNHPLRRVVEVLVSELNSLLLGPVLFAPRTLPAFDWSRHEDLAKESMRPDIEGMRRTWVNRRLLAQVVNATIGEQILAQEPETRGPVTDVYIVSHGWHRKFFSAVSAYDRLYSRFSVLLSRRRLRSPWPYHPLFLMLHWNSDPGEDQWVDPGGRRRLKAFLANVEAVFQRPMSDADLSLSVGSRFTDVFEAIYQHLTRLSAPDTQALHMPAEVQQADKDLAQKLSAFTIRDAPHATPAEKIGAAWRCYFEADPLRPLLNQNDQPTSILGAGRLLKVVVKFLFAVAGAVLLNSVLSKVLSTLSGLHWQDLAFWREVGRYLLGALVGGFVLMLLCILQQRYFTRNRRASGKPFVALIAWGLMQFPLILFQLAYLVVTTALVALLSGIGRLVGLKKVPGLYDERRGWRDETLQPLRTGANRDGYDRDHATHLASPCLLVSALTRLPIEMLTRAVSRDTKLPGFVTVVDSQLAFWQMQRRGAAAGEAAAAFIASLMGNLEREELLCTSDEGRSNVRVHLMGHSFGSLLVANMARCLALTPAYKSNVPHLRSICLIQGAIASSWFEREVTLLNFIEGALVCIFSGYDTANGFYYPFANAARSAAGYLGLTFVGAKTAPDRLPSLEDANSAALFASVLETPDLARLIHRHGRQRQPPYLLNLDASRVIFNGPSASGGGHNDIFKDDVVQLLWAVTLLGGSPSQHQGPPPQLAPG